MPVGNSAPAGIDLGSPTQQSNLLTTVPLNYNIYLANSIQDYDDCIDVENDSDTILQERLLFEVDELT